MIAPASRKQKGIRKTTAFLDSQVRRRITRAEKPGTTEVIHTVSGLQVMEEAVKVGLGGN